MPRFKSILDLQEVFPTEQDCINYFEEVRWNEKPISPFDPNSKVYKCANNKYKCKNTRKYFNVKTGTMFENSKIPLRKWFWSSYVFSSHKKVISSHQLAKDISITQKSAWFLLQRLRYASNLTIFKTILKGFVEIDEAFIGGANQNRHWDKKIPRCQGRSWKDKVPILGMVERDSGKLFAQVVPDVKLSTLKPIIKDNIKVGSTLYSDEWYRHSKLDRLFNHQIVNHSAKQYVNGDASTNAIENRWSHLNRIIFGTYHHTSKKHLQGYVDEFTMRSNARNKEIQERFDLLLSSTVGKRLTYQELIS